MNPIQRDNQSVLLSQFILHAQNQGKGCSMFFKMTVLQVSMYVLHDKFVITININVVYPFFQ